MVFGCLVCHGLVDWFVCCGVCWWWRWWQRVAQRVVRLSSVVSIRVGPPVPVASDVRRRARRSNKQQAPERPRTAVLINTSRHQPTRQPSVLFVRIVKTSGHRATAGGLEDGQERRLHRRQWQQRQRPRPSSVLWGERGRNRNVLRVSRGESSEIERGCSPVSSCRVFLLLLRLMCVRVLVGVLKRWSPLLRTEKRGLLAWDENKR